jgi:hypothetical protein
MPFACYRAGAPGYTTCTPPVCAVGSYLKADTGKCTLCAPGQFQDATGQDTCKLCPAGSYQKLWGRPACQLCDGETYQDQAGQASCMPCLFNPAGEPRPWSHTQLMHTHPAIGLIYMCATSCTAGAPGYTTCTPPICAVGSYLKADTGKCTLCSPGQFQDATGQDTCKLCPAGSYQNLWGRPACQLCDGETYQDQAGQASCMACLYNPAGETAV